MNWLYYAIPASLTISIVASIYLRRWMVMRALAADALWRLTGDPVFDKAMKNYKKLTNPPTKYPATQAFNRMNKTKATGRSDTKWPNNFGSR